MWVKFGKSLFKVNEIEDVDSYVDKDKLWIRIKAKNRVILEEQEDLQTFEKRLDEICEWLNEEEKKNIREEHEIFKGKNEHALDAARFYSVSHQEL